MNSTADCLWCPDAVAPDSYVAFRGTLHLPDAAEVELRILGVAWYALWVDGCRTLEGPPRFTREHPQYQSHRIPLSPGRHVVAVQVHHVGVETRMLKEMPPFLYCQAILDGRQVPTKWKCVRLAGYESQVQRINPQLSWVEWCDTRRNPADWQQAGFDDSEWSGPVEATVDLGPLSPIDIAPVRNLPVSGRIIGQGTLAESFGYERDDMAARFFLRKLSPIEVPSQGVWRRYDLGQVRLVRPRLVMDVPAGAVIEFACSEQLHHDRVSPWITLSTGKSANMDHYIARGGLQEFSCLTPRGGRYVEVHVLAPPDQIRFVREQFEERCYYDQPEGSFACGDKLLERIWMTGVDTHRACAEDTLVDNPTRERGQWTGDVVTVAMDIASVAYSDLRLCRRGLVQAAWCAREDGMVSGLCPGGGVYLTTYAAQWITACMHYRDLTGDHALLRELFPAAQRNIDAFEHFMSHQGLRDEAGWGFVDWGYVRNQGPSDMGVNLHYLAALGDMCRWCLALGDASAAERYTTMQEHLRKIVASWFFACRIAGDFDWTRIGYHRAVLGLRLGFIDPSAERECIAFIKRHLLRCFPNDPAAPRLDSPTVTSDRLITPYFGHFALAELAERGEMEFVLQQYRTCWGWALQEDRTTWLEVFDPRWSHCHQWSGCPTWQLSRYCLGLTPAFAHATNCFSLKLIPGDLKAAAGKMPLQDGAATATIRWERKLPEQIAWSVQSPVPLSLRYPAGNSMRQTEAGMNHSLTLIRRENHWHVAEARDALPGSTSVGFADAGDSGAGH